MRILILTLTASLLIGCSSTQVNRYGDATVKRTDRVTAFDPMVAAKVIYELELPPVSLARRGTTRFKVRGIRPGMVPTDVTLRYPHYPSLSARDMVEQWGDAEFRIRLVAVKSGEAFTHTFNLAGTNWGYDASVSDRAHFTQPLTGHPLSAKFRAERWSQVTDYDVEIKVTEPTRSGSHYLDLSTAMLVFFDESKTD